MPAADVRDVVVVGAGHNALTAACRTIGFLQVTGHGIPGDVVEGLAAAMDDFFALPLATKKAWTRPAGENRGYTPPKSEALASSLGMASGTRMKDFFEAFNVGSGFAYAPSGTASTGRSTRRSRAMTTSPRSSPGPAPAG